MCRRRRATNVIIKPAFDKTKAEGGDAAGSGRENPEDQDKASKNNPKHFQLFTIIAKRGRRNYGFNRMRWNSRVHQPLGCQELNEVSGFHRGSQQRPDWRLRWFLQLHLKPYRSHRAAG